MNFFSKAWLHSPRAAVFVIACLITIFYAPLFGGYWLGDDFVNLLISHDLAQDGKLLSGALDYFTKGTSSAGSMYRPLQMATLLGNYAIAGAYYPGWFGVNFVLHLANAILIFYVVRAFAARFSTHNQAIPVLAPLLAALAFALAPTLAEGVFWVSARADACVTLLSLLSLLAWVHSAKPQQGRAVWWFPALLVPALLIKESAAVLPLQMALVMAALGPAMRRQHFFALALSALLVCVFFVLRWSLFGHAFGVYVAPGSAAQGVTFTLLWGALQSVAPWWQALTEATPTAALVYLVLLCGLALWACVRVRGAYARISIALLGAAGGLALATLVNLGGLAATGEGGRLTYSPICWLAVAAGVALAGAISGKRVPWLPHALLASLIVCGGIVLHSIIRQAGEAQSTTRAIAQSISTWSANNTGHAMLIIPEMMNFVVATRNAQGGLAMPPVQPLGLAHRVMPTLVSELPTRYDQYRNGMATQLAANPPVRFDEKSIATMLSPADASWPTEFLCWPASARSLQKLSPPQASGREAWVNDLRRSLLETEELCIPASYGK